jgi:hypothetical protein
VTFVIFVVKFLPISTHKIAQGEQSLGALKNYSSVLNPGFGCVFNVTTPLLLIPTTPSVTKPHPFLKKGNFA